MGKIKLGRSIGKTRLGGSIGAVGQTDNAKKKKDTPRGESDRHPRRSESQDYSINCACERADDIMCPRCEQVMQNDFPSEVRRASLIM